jgi:hypothetical protein
MQARILKKQVSYYSGVALDTVQQSVASRLVALEKNAILVISSHVTQQGMEVRTLIQSAF